MGEAGANAYLRASCLPFFSAARHPGHVTFPNRPNQVVSTESFGAVHPHQAVTVSFHQDDDFFSCTVDSAIGSHSRTQDRPRYTQRRAVVVLHQRPHFSLGALRSGVAIHAGVLPRRD